MKFNISLTIIGLVTALAFTIAIPNGWASNSDDTASNQAQKDRSMRIARGAQYWAQHCKRCHNLRNGNELTDEEWEVAVTHMQVRANLPGQVARDVKLFLKSSN